MEVAPNKYGSSVDRRTIDNLIQGFGNDHDAFRNVRTIFVQSSEDLLQDIERFIDLGDRSAIIRAVHRLRGSSANFGAKRLIDLCIQLELQAADDSMDSIRQVLQDIKEELSKVVIAIYLL